MRKINVLGIDAGGTMTDTFIVDDKGKYVIGKALTTSSDEAVGFVNSAKDALRYWDMSLEEAFPQFVSAIYSGTSMINRLLERKGKKIGLIVTAGMEDYLRLERGRQTYLGYSYSDKIHVATHRHNKPIVSRDCIRGVRGRIDASGNEFFPLNRREAEEAINQLLDKKIECLCVNFLFSYRNAKHENEVREIARRVMMEHGLHIPIFLASERYPVRGDFTRLNTLLIDAYVAETSREQLRNIRSRMQDFGADCDLRLMASHGGTISIEARELAKSLVSGPIGGVIGGRLFAQHFEMDNIVCSDIGGTSLDVSLITAGESDIKTEPDINRFLLNLPMVRIDSIGAGTGSFVRLDPNSNRIEIGPDSAGPEIGMCYTKGKVTNVTITDCNVVLGRVNPDYFLGGEIILDTDRAYQAIKEQLADSLGMDVYEVAAGIIDIFETTLRNEIEAMITGKGYLPANYTLLCYGGGGPLHVAEFSEGLQFEDILVPSWAAGFSAFGCACADFEYRYDHTIDLPFNPNGIENEYMDTANIINKTWEILKTQVEQEYAKCNIDADNIVYHYLLRMQYLGQLEDLEISSPVPKIMGFNDWLEIVSKFEETYSRLYSRSARSPELGYFVTRAVVYGRATVQKPQFINDEIQSEQPPEEALKGNRRVFWKDQWLMARIYEMGRLKAGNMIEGFSILESPSTTFVIPPNRVARLDEHLIFHLSNLK